MLEKLNIFKYYKLENFFEDGFTEEDCKLFCSVNPYSKDHYKSTKPEEFVSYSYVLNNTIEYKEYLKLENKFVVAFEELYNNFKIFGLRFHKDKYNIIEYCGFLSFKDDLIKGLREDTSYNFIIDDHAIAIHCNYDLVIVIYGYMETNFSEIFDVFGKHDLYVTNLSNISSEV